VSADQFLQFLTNALFLLIFARVAHRALRRPSRANVDIALLFGVTALAILHGRLVAQFGFAGHPLAAATGGALIMALPYLLLRLQADFAGVPWQLLRAAEAGLVLSVVCLFVMAPLPVALTLALVAYFVGLTLCTAIGFLSEARRSRGVTSRRMWAVGWGSIFLGLAILVAGFQAIWPEAGMLWTIASRFAGLASGVSYFLGFSPPAWLRRAWQEPDLRAFLGRAASLPRLSDTQAIVRELQRGAAASVGAPAAVVGLWLPDEGVVRLGLGRRTIDLRPGETIAGRAFAERRPILSVDASRDDPQYAHLYQLYGACAVLAAPIPAGEQPLGVLVVYAPRAPIFGEDDLVLVQLLADQAAVILESRALIDEAARVRAREEAARLKDDFLSSAAHDLKTPLAALTTQAQLLERRALRQPDAPADLAGIRRIIEEVRRLNRLVIELLDASRLDTGQLLSQRVPNDLAELARQSCERHSGRSHRCVLDAPEPVIGFFDPVRILQLLDNLLENAVKYSPGGGEILVTIRGDDGQARLGVLDHGIGIPVADLPALFERFHRGSNVDDRRFSGMGLGLYICRGIVEQHGGRIWAVSRPEGGTTFHVTLPLAQSGEPPSVPMAQGVVRD
jgi:signal transduction histidine kinase